MNSTESMYKPDTPFSSGRIQCGSLHEISYEEYGNPNGKPAVYLHGGPGAGSHSSMAQYFNPEKYRIVLFDQRGCGKSTPHAELRENTTWDLVADIERIRSHLNISKWLVCGGSWGSALALAYAQTHPEAVTEIVLRGIFTLRRSELLWFYQEGASWVFPDLWEGFLAPIPLAERGDLMSAYHRRLTGDDPEERLACAKAWSRWEGATLSLLSDPKREENFSDDTFATAFARIECHYFVNGGFFESDGQLIANAAKIRHIPSVIIQGRYDIVTPAKTAWELHRVLPESSLKIVPDAGHSATEPGIAREIVAATDRFADN